MRSPFSGARRYKYFGDGCDFAVHLQQVGPGHGDINISVMVVILSMPCPYRYARSFVFCDGWDHPCDRAGGAGARRYKYFGDGCDFVDAVPLQICPIARWRSGVRSAHCCQKPGFSEVLSSLPEVEKETKVMYPRLVRSQASLAIARIELFFQAAASQRHGIAKTPEKYAYE